MFKTQKDSVQNLIGCDCQGLKENGKLYYNSVPQKLKMITACSINWQSDYIYFKH